MIDPDRREGTPDRRTLIQRDGYVVRLIGGRASGQVVNVTALGVELHRLIDFHRAGAFVERYRYAAPVDGVWQAHYVGIKRSNELARHFNPVRLPK